MDNCLPPSTIWKNKLLKKDNTERTGNATSSQVQKQQTNKTGSACGVFA